jgi:tetratricopeptide (TPR) repeat protein
VRAADAALADDEAEGTYTAQYFMTVVLRSLALFRLGEEKNAYADLQTLRRFTGMAPPRFSAAFNLFYAEICTHLGRISEADSIVSMYENLPDSVTGMSAQLYRETQGLLAMKRGEDELAVRHLLDAVEEDRNNYLSRYALAEAYLSVDRLDDAIDLLESMTSRYDDNRMQDPILGVRALYLLGDAYQRAGQDAKAVEQFETFLAIWKDADPELEEVPDARRRLEALRSSG